MSQLDKKCRPKSRPSEDACDIFEPSVYTPNNSKARADYIRKIGAKITADLDASLLAEELPDGEDPSIELIVSGEDPTKHLHFIMKYLRGPRGFNGSVDNFVVLTEEEYDKLRVYDPNKFYYTYEGDGSGGGGGGGEIPTGSGSIDISNNSINGFIIANNTLITENTITNNTLYI